MFFFKRAKINDNRFVSKLYIHHSDSTTLQQKIYRSQSPRPLLRGRVPLIYCAHAQFISKMAAVQSGQVDAEEEKEIKTETSNDAPRNNSSNDGRPLSASAGAPSCGGGVKSSSGTTEEQQTLLAVLQFLKKNNLSESVEILRREAGLSEEPEDQKGSECSGTGSGAGTKEPAAGDASSLLSRVSNASSAAAATAAAAVAAQAPSKGLRAVPNILI